MFCLVSARVLDILGASLPHLLVAFSRVETKVVSPKLPLIMMTMIVMIGARGAHCGPHAREWLARVRRGTSVLLSSYLKVT